VPYIMLIMRTIEMKPLAWACMRACIKITYSISVWHYAIKAPVFNLQSVASKACGFGGLVVSMLPSGTQVRGFKPDRSRRPHIAALRHVKEPYNYRGSRTCMAKFDRTFLAHSSTFR
jgi:hypothetical protein